MKSRQIKIYTILAMITLAAAYFRFHHLLLNSLWLDELFSARISNPSNSFHNVYLGTVSDVHPPLYQLTLWALYHLFGYTELTGRAFSATIGTLLIPAIYLLGKRLFNAETGLIAALLASTNYFLIWYSQETRSYELLAFLTVVSFYCFLRFLTSPSVKNLAMYALSTSALINTHLFGFLPLAAQALVLLYNSTTPAFDKKLFLRSAIAGSLISASILPTLPYILKQAKITSFWIAPADPNFLQNYYISFFSSPALSTIIAILLVLGLFHLFSEKTPRNSLHTLILWCTVAITVPYIRSIYSTPVLTLRNTIVLLPALLIISAYAISTLRTRFSILVLSVTLSAFALTNIHVERRLYSVASKEDWRSVIQLLNGTDTSTPIYAAWKDYYETYAHLTGSNFKLLDITELSNETGTPALFHVIDAHDMTQLPDAIQKKFNATLIDQHEYLSASLRTYRSNLVHAVDVPLTSLHKSKDFPVDQSQLVMPWNGYVETPLMALDNTPRTIRIVLRGTDALGESPNLHVSIRDKDGNLTRDIADIKTDSLFSERDITLSTTAPGNYIVRLEFTNDAADATQDRNIYISRIYKPHNEKQ